jgi:hypothetical protein
MKMIRNYLMIFAAVFLVSLAGCDGDDDAPVQEKDGIIASPDDVDLDVAALEGEITTTITLTADKDWVLSGPLVVNSGAKLIIEAGTTIKAEAGGTDVYISVERDGDIEAIGTAANPIRITSAAASPAAGNWGGLLIMGNAKITGNGTSVTEVVDFIYGNGAASDDADDSGTLAYVVLEYTGARINGEKEFNGLTLYGVGSGTSISNIAVLYGDDDAVEWFGGAVDVDNLLVVNATDDMFDWTQGWSGTGTNFYGIRTAGYDKLSADTRGIEGDGNLDGLSPAAAGQSNVTINNLTIVNNSTVAIFEDVIKVRRNSNVTITNARVIWAAGAPAPKDFVDYSDAAGSAVATATVTISGTGTNLNTADNNLGANTGTVTVAETTGVANAATLFAWTGFTGF